MQPKWFSSDDQTNFLNNVKRLSSLIKQPVHPDSQRLMVFSHIPKTGGTTLEHILAKNHRLSDVLHINAPDLNGCPDLLKLKKNPPDLICGHHPMHGLLYALLPDLPLAHITMLRHPVDRVLSFYNYILGKSDHPLHAQCQSLSLEDFLRQKPTPELANGQTRRLTGTLHRQQNQPADSAEHACQVLEDCFTDVWVTEQFDQALLMLSRRYGMQDVYYQPHNVSPKRVRREDLSDATLNLIGDMNQEDARLHRWAAQRSEQQYNQLFSAADLAAFQQHLLSWQALLAQRGTQHS
jgi:hypothetical protein